MFIQAFNNPLQKHNPVINLELLSPNR